MIDEALERRKLYQKKTILFVDEVHRWNKAQQDALLPHVENGTITLIGATTENPYFEVIGALVSRSRVFQLRPLHDEDVRALLGARPQRPRARLRQAEDPGRRRRHPAPDQRGGGDARNALNALELAVESTLAERRGRHPHHPGGGPEFDPAPGGAVR